MFEFCKNELLEPDAEPAPARRPLNGIGDASMFAASVTDALLYGESDKC